MSDLDFTLAAQRQQLIFQAINGPGAKVAA